MKEKLLKTGMFSQCRHVIAVLLAVVIMGTMVPVVTNAEVTAQEAANAKTGIPMKTVSVAVYDYAALAEGFGVSKDGVILAPYKVSVSVNTAPIDVIIKALSENNISYVNDTTYGNYISSIANLGPNYDPKYTPEGGYNMTGWALSYNNDDYDNWGIDYLTLKDGDSVAFHYQTFQDRIAAKSAGLPTMDVMEIGGVKVSFATTTKYDENYNEIFSYRAEGTDVQMTGEGTKEKPFILSVTLDSSVDLTKVPVSYQTKALEPYRKVTGLSQTMDLTKEQSFTITSNGNRSAYYTVKATKKEASVQKQEITGVKDSYTKTYGAKAFSLQAAARTGMTYASADKKVAVVDENGKVTVKGCGQTTITITASGDGYETVTKTVKLTVTPKKQSIKAASKKKGTLTVILNKNAQISGYQITYSTSSKFTKKKTKTISISANGKKNVTKSINKNLVSGKKYYVKARAYKTYNKKKYYGSYSAVKVVKVK